MRIFGVVLAAGQGKRMKSALYKVLHPVCGKPMVGYVADLLVDIEAERIVTIVGHGAEAVQHYLGERTEYVLQEQQLGTAHAMIQAGPLLKNEQGLTIVICGDTPLITKQSLLHAIELHQEKGAAASVLTAVTTHPAGYGRIVRNEQGTISRIVEQKDCTPEENDLREINTGTYLFDNLKLFQALQQVTNHNVQGEYYLTDVIGILNNQGEVIEGCPLAHISEMIGINDRTALAEAERLMRERINQLHMINGVTLIDPATTYIESDVRIGMDTIIYPGTFLKGQTIIAAACTIGPHTEITDSEIGDGAEVKHSVLNKAIVGAKTTVGPFAHLRPGSKTANDVKIGNFVEIKNAILDEGSKVSHLSYVGDAKVGKNVNIGCGVVTVNYDGYNKHLTEIEDDAFVGSNVNLIAPIKIGKGAYVVAGSTLTDSVPDYDLAIARARQINKTGYADVMRSRLKDS